MSSIPSPPSTTPAAVRAHRPLWARALALVTSPRSVFEEFIDRPSWFWPNMCVTIVAVIVGYSIWNSVFVPYSLEQAQSRGAPAEAVARMEQMYANPGARIGFSLFGGTANFVVIVIEGLALF